MTIYRILKDFAELGLVNKTSEGKWYLLMQTESEFDKARRLDHSQKLIPGFECLQKEILRLGNAPNERENAIKEAAEEHLRTAYAEIHSKLERYRRPIQDTLIAMQAFRKGEMLKVDGKYDINLEALVNSVSWVEPKGKDKFTTRRLNMPYAFKFNTVDEAQHALKEARAKAKLCVQENGECIVVGPIEIESDSEIANQLFQDCGDISKEISMLIMRIQHGSPLEGNCKLCRADFQPHT